MKKISKFFTLMALMFIFLIAGVLSSCFRPSNSSSSSDSVEEKTPLTIEKVISACEEFDYVSIEIDMHAEAEWKEAMIPSIGGFQLKKSALDLNIKENLLSKEGDYLTSQGLNGQKRRFYLRGEDVFQSDYYYGEGTGDTARVLYSTNIDLAKLIFDNALSQIELDYAFELGAFEKKEFSLKDAGSFLIFAEKYDAIIIEDDALTFDLNKLIYNIIGELRAAFEGLGKDTTIGQIYAKKEIKNLIDNLAGGDDALTIYEELMEAGFDEINGESFSLEDFKPQAKQSFYDYIGTLLNSQELMQDSDSNGSFEEVSALGEMKVYDLLGETEEEAQEILDKLSNLFKNVTEDEFLLDLSAELESEFVFSIKDYRLTFGMDGDKLCSYHVKGEIVFKDAALTGQRMILKMDLREKYFQEEQPLADLNEFDFNVYKEVYQDGDMEGYAVTPAPGVNGVWTPVFKVVDGKIVGMYFTGEEVVQTSYNAEKDVYEYSFGGTNMYARLMPCNNYHLSIEFYVNDGTDKFFNYTIVYLTKTSKRAAVSYEEYKNPPEEESSIEEQVFDGLRYRYDEFTDSYILLGFRDGYSVADLVIPDAVNGKPVRAIASEAFNQDKKLRSVVIPASIDYVSYLAFEYCSNLTAVESYAAVLGQNAFFCCGKLETISLKGVTILKSAIGNCDNLKSAVLSKKVNFINNYAFYSWNIDIITYEGTMEEWRAIVKMASWAYGLEKIVCSDGVLDAEGKVIN